MHTRSFSRAKDRKKDGSFYNVPVSFDIETTSFKNEKGQYCGIMYVWQFAIYNEVFYGRTMEQYQEFCQILTDFLQLGVKAKLIVYVHNLAFEFQFIRKYFKWERVFADKKLQAMLQSHRNQDSVVLAPKQIYRPMEQNRESRNKH